MNSLNVGEQAGPWATFGICSPVSPTHSPSHSPLRDILLTDGSTLEHPIYADQLPPPQRTLFPSLPLSRSRATSTSPELGIESRWWSSVLRTYPTPSKTCSGHWSSGPQGHPGHLFPAADQCETPWSVSALGSLLFWKGLSERLLRKGWDLQKREAKTAKEKNKKVPKWRSLWFGTCRSPRKEIPGFPLRPAHPFSCDLWCPLYSLGCSTGEPWKEEAPERDHTWAVEVPA